jgi:UDP-2,3-diacylglucosamine pyrophosphatase LpxH
MQKFAFLTDLHFGFERRSGHKVPLHDPKALDCTLSFLQDFKPHHLILGGDILDCGAISHHNNGKPGRTEGLRLLSDARECRAIIKELEKFGSETSTYIVGNHEDWLHDLEEENPGIEGMFEVRDLLKLDNSWKVIPQGGHHSLGKLTFLHGDQLSGGEQVAKAGVIAYERSIRFGHFHTFQAFTKTSALDLKLGRTGIAVPCLCTKDPKYGEGKATRWVQGFNFGYIHEDGSYNDYVSVITNGKTCIGGKVYKG